jgi:three-Cys-motif partner protein
VPSFKPKELWSAEPHTLAKIEIVRRYLHLWFTILSANPRNQRLIYIDGFAGPGEYKDGQIGSPIAALNSGIAAIEDAKGRLDKIQVEFLFIEKEPEFAAHLRSKLAATALPTTFKVSVKEGTFAAHAGDFLQQQGAALPPTFAFIDPFGATKVPFELIQSILRNKSCEVLLNLDSDGAVRLLAAQSNLKNQENLTTLFGDESWKSLKIGQSMQQLSAAVLRLYIKRLRTLPGVKYVFPFTMNTSDRELNYHLVFASQHPLGLEKMKEAMRTVDKSGAYSFSDDFSTQALLEFNFAAPGEWAEKMVASLGNQWRSYEEFRDFALNETPFINPKAMFEYLKGLSRIQVLWKGEAAKIGFPEERIAKVIVLPRH